MALRHDPTMTPPFSLAGKRILITGASGVLGTAVAEAASAAGARLLLTGRRQEVLSELAGRLDAEAEAFDLSDLSRLPEWIKSKASLEPFDGLVHAAGIQIPRPVRLLELAEFETVIHTNLTSAFMAAKGFRQKGVTRPGGSLVFLSSVMGTVGQAAQTSYCASKGGLDSMTRALALELARDALRVNTIAPGLIESVISGRLKNTLTEQQYQAVIDMHPLGLGRPADVAHAAVFLLSDAARWVTGTSLVVDGGYTAH